jgi:periplasmic protein TonB
VSSVAASAGERLAWAIFVAAAAHGLLILGIGFTPPERGGPEEVPTLEVTLLDSPVPGQQAPDDARYLAQAHQEGAGNVEEQVRPEFFDQPPVAADSATAEQGAEPDLAVPEPEPAAAERVASWASPLAATIALRPPEQEALPEAPPEGGVTQVTAAEEREYFLSVAARETIFAEYLAAWKARMERIGTINYPTVAQQHRTGNPVLEVALAADGTLRQVRVTRSSGSDALDRAALDLVRLASPYDAFPPAVRAQFDVLRFAYEWRFIEGRAGPGELRAAPY